MGHLLHRLYGVDAPDDITQSAVLSLNHMQKQWRKPNFDPFLGIFLLAHGLYPNLVTISAPRTSDYIRDYTHTFDF